MVGRVGWMAPVRICRLGREHATLAPLVRLERIFTIQGQRAAMGIRRPFRPSFPGARPRDAVRMAAIDISVLKVSEATPSRLQVAAHEAELHETLGFQLWRFERARASRAPYWEDEVS